MSTPPEDLTASADEGVRVDAPTAPETGSVASEPEAPRPPRRARRTASAQVDPLPATTDDEPVADTVFAPLDDREERRSAKAAARAQAKAKRKARTTTTTTRAVGPRTERRYRQTVVKVDLWSVTKLSLCFYLSAMFVTLVALIALWVIADAAGYVKSIEDFLGDLLSAKDNSFKFLSGEVLRGTILVSLVIVALQVVITVIAASFYNIFAELFGGLEITVKEEEAPPRA